jgi:hypothetical protein
MQLLIDLFSKPPASFAWATNDQGRTIGTSEGFILDIWPDRVEAAALFPPDRADLAARNGTLLELLILAMRPDWQSGPSWLAQAMRMAARKGSFEEVNVTRRARFVWDRANSRATLKVSR